MPQGWSSMAVASMPAAVIRSSQLCESGTTRKHPADDGPWPLAGVQVEHALILVADERNPPPSHVRASNPARLWQKGHGFRRDR